MHHHHHHHHHPHHHHHHHHHQQQQQQRVLLLPLLCLLLLLLPQLAPAGSGTNAGDVASSSRWESFSSPKSRNRESIMSIRRGVFQFQTWPYPSIDSPNPAEAGVYGNSPARSIPFSSVHQHLQKRNDAVEQNLARDFQATKAESVSARAVAIRTDWRSQRRSLAYGGSKYIVSGAMLRH